VLVSGGADGRIQLWSAFEQSASDSNELLGKGFGLVRAVAFTPDGQHLATVGPSNTVLIWDLSDPNDRRTRPLLVPGGLTLAFSSQGNRLVTGSDDGTVRFWDWENAVLLTVLSGHQGSVNAVAFSPDGSVLASGGQDQLVQIWQLDGTSRPLRGHAGPVNAVAFSPDGKWLASGSSDHTVRLWNMNRPNDSPVVLSQPGGWVLSVAFSPDGKQLVSGSADRTVRLWKIDAQQLAEEICEAVKRGLTDEEWNRFVGEDIPYGEYEPCPGASL